MPDLLIIQSVNQDHPIKQSTNQLRHIASGRKKRACGIPCGKVSALAGVEGKAQPKADPTAGGIFDVARKGIIGMKKWREIFTSLLMSTAPRKKKHGQKTK